MAKQAHKALAQQKRHRRQWITFMRMCRYGINNFSRNAWLTIAATAVMTITLLIIFVTYVAQNVLTDSVREVSRKIDMSIYLKPTTKQSDAEYIVNDLEKLSNVESVKYISPEEARKDFIDQNKTNQSTLEALKSANAQFSGTIRVNLRDVNDTSQLEAFVKNDSNLKKHLHPDKQPSFAGSRREAIKSIGRWVSFAQQLGLVASIIFVAISSLIVFNTIRMAIFNRKEEIQMMKLIGADKSFIRGPFVVEAVVYGVIAGIIATALGIALLSLLASSLNAAGVAVGPTLDMLTTYAAIVLLAMMGIGAIIGTASSLLATRRYLKI